MAAPASRRMAPATVMEIVPPSSGASEPGAPRIWALGAMVRLPASIVTGAPAPDVSWIVAPLSMVSPQVPKLRSDPGWTG